jgi:threonine dehydrogenase-like Zn-dependent dehydrogenase
MRAVRFDGNRALMAHAPEPSLAHSEVLIRPLLLAIASPDLAILDGLVPFKGTLGHEFVGIVEEVANPEHQRWKAKRVVGSISIACSKCDRCRAGLSNHCHSRQVLGQHNRDGCFADRFALPVANLVEVPKSVDDEQAVFANSLAAALHAATIIRFENKPYVTVLGDGPVALLAAQVIAKLNASVRLLGKHQAKFSLCEHWGIKHRHIGEVGRRMDQDIVLDCTGSPSGFELATQLVRPRGKIILKSTPAPVPSSQDIRRPPGPDLASITNNEIEVLGARCGKLADAIASLAKGDIDVRPLVTARRSLDEFADAIQLARHPDSIKVLMS